MNSADLSFYNSRKYKLALSITISVFFYLFIIFFLPFGVDNYNPDHEYTFDFFLEIFFFFVPLSLVLLFNEFLFRPLVVKKATLRNIIFWSIWTLVLAGTVIFFTYNYLGNWHDFLLRSYFEFLVNCSAVLIFPMVGTFFYFRYRGLQYQMDHILTSKEESIDKDRLLEFTGVGSKDRITLSVSGFLYGKAQDNYVELIYLEQDRPRKFLMRTTLSSLIDSVGHSAIVRCHRSYMVNLVHVTAIKGGNQDMTLHLASLDIAIPVSKSFRTSVLENLRVLKNFG